MKLITIVFLALVLTLGAGLTISAQTETAKGSLTEEQKKAKEESEKRAFALLEQIINEAQMMRLPENRIRVQIGVADLLWASNEGRARSLFSVAADSVAEMVRNSDTALPRRGQNLNRGAAQLRQELVLTVARHDAPLAYQLLAATRPLTPSTADPRNPRRFELEDNLEQSLLSQVAALDPKTALQNAEQLLDKGEYPRSLPEVLTQLQQKDKEAASKLEDKMLKKLQSANMLSNPDAANLSLRLLQSGPRVSEDVKTAASSNSRPLLRESVYQDLMGTLIDAALKATPQPASAQRRPNAPQNRGANRGGAITGQGATPTPPTDAQIEQSNARRLLSGLRGLLPQVDQYFPSRSAAVRQKMTDLGMGNNPRSTLSQISNLMQQGTSDSLVSAASSAPPQVQNRIYQQAALKALDEGNADRARQIANDHLQAGQRESVLRTVEFRQLADKTEPGKIEDVRDTLSRLSSDAERIDLLLRLSTTVRAKNPELAVQLLDESREFTNRRASSYQQFEQQLRVAAAYKDLADARGLEVLEPGIMQLNELLSAAAVLSGFEVSVFRDGEMPLQGGNGLSDMVRRYGQEIGQL
ncbi:MAG: hypothetical protein ACRD6N_18685, partial [Pyrinomonadaceae bacterium]